MIKRYYVRSSSSFYTNVDVKMKPLSIKFLNAEDIRTGNLDLQLSFRQWWTQIGKNATLKDVKIRIHDHLRAAGYNVSLDDVRLWLFTVKQQEEDDKSKKKDALRPLKQCCINVKKALDGELQPEAPEQQEGEEIELNSGVQFTGQSLEPLINSALRINQLTLGDAQQVIVEFRESPQHQFAFVFNKNQKLQIGVCEWCNSRNILRAICACKNVKYCNEDCMEKDKRFHIDKCSAQADGELQELEDGDFNESSMKGLTGLTNLGNTCYMNSSIQCISNTYELTEYFLQRRYKSLLEREYKNPLGTEGRIVQAWAKLIGEMWKGSSRVVRPDLFKRILGQYNVIFEGYGQHDSQECINTILDFMSEDLYKQGKKPYVEQTEADGKTDQEASLEAWNKHVYRNESIIVDLFHGQFKSTLVCSICSRVSITFDPFLMVSLPIPLTRWEKFEAYYIQYS